MRNTATHSITLKKKLNKCKSIFHAYSDLQFKYGELLDDELDVLEIKANVKIEDTNYTTDFYIVDVNGNVRIRECVYKEKIMKPMTITMLDISRNYWLKNGITDWGIVLDE